MKFEAWGCEFEIGRGMLFLSVPGVGEIYAEVMTNEGKSRPVGAWGTDTGAMIVELGTWHIVLSPSRTRAPAVPL